MEMDSNPLFMKSVQLSL